MAKVMIEEKHKKQILDQTPDCGKRKTKGLYSLTKRLFWSKFNELLTIRPESFGLYIKKIMQ